MANMGPTTHVDTKKARRCCRHPPHIQVEMDTIPLTVLATPSVDIEINFPVAGRYHLRGWTDAEWERMPASARPHAFRLDTADGGLWVQYRLVSPAFASRERTGLG